MSPLTPEHKKMLATIGQQYSEFAELVGAWRGHELEFMSQGTQDNFGVFIAMAHLRLR